MATRRKVTSRRTGKSVYVSKKGSSTPKPKGPNKRDEYYKKWGKYFG